MKLWLRSPSRCIKVCDVTLLEGAVPCIDGRQIDIHGIEPGVWAKALVVEWVCIDLDKEVLSWATCDPCTQRTSSERMAEERDRLPDTCQHTQTIPLKPDMPVDTDFDQLLEIASHMSDNPGNHTLGKSVRLLHVYILPNITFDKEHDAENIRRSVGKQTKSLDQLDEEFSNIATQREGLKKPMRVWRWEMCERISQKKIELTSCGIKFLEVLMDGLKDDLAHCYPEITAANQKVYRWKEKADDPKVTNLTNVLDQLESARKERSDLIDNLNRVLECREEIDMFVGEGLVHPEPKELAGDLQGYLRTVDCQKRLRERMYEINHKKICAISVREALVRAQEELKRFSRTPGLERSVTGNNYSSNILPEDNLPKEWRTLQKRVSDAVENNKQLKDLKTQFEDEIRNSFKDRKRRSRRVSSKEKKRVAVQDSDDEHFEKAKQFRESFRATLPREHYRGIANQIEKKIVNHFEEMTKALLSELKMKVHGERVWLCYERCTFPHLFTPYIEKVYEKAYSKEVRVLKDIMASVTVEDIACTEDKYMLNLLKLYTPENEGDFDNAQSDTGSTSDATSTDQTDSSVESGVTVEDLPVVVRRRHLTVSARYRRRHMTIQDGHLFTPPRRSQSFCSESLFYQDLNKLSPAEHRPGTTYENYRPFNKDTLPSNNNTIEFDDSGTYGDNLYAAATMGVDVETHRRFFDSTDSAVTATSSDGRLSPDAVRSSRTNNKEFLRLYQSPISSFMEVTATSVPMKKYQWLFKCLSELTETAQEQAKVIQCGRTVGLSGDEVLTALTFFLLQCDPDRVIRAYTQIVFLQEYLPSFLSAGHFAFTVNQFLVAYQYLIEEGWKKGRSDPIDIANGAKT